VTGPILTNLKFNRDVTRQLLKDVDDARMVEQPPGIPNHAAWQLGHLAYSLEGASQMLGGSFALPAGWNDRYGMGSRPLADRGAYPSKNELLDRLEEAADSVASVMRGGDAAAMDATNPVPDPMFQKMMPTLGDAIAFLVNSHYAYHLGQMSGWRRAIGLGSALGV